MKKILVVGMGPGGLSFTNALLKEVQSQSLDYQITLIDKRADFTRYQKVVLYTEDARAFFFLSGLSRHGVYFQEESRIRFKLENIPAQQSELSQIAQKTLEFLILLSSNHNVIAIKDLQEYQFAILKLQNDGRCTILQNSEIQSFDMSCGQNVVHIKSTVTLEVIDYVFDNLIVADGKNSHTLKQVGDFVDLPECIELQKNENNAYGCVLLDAPETFDFLHEECATNSLKDSRLSLALDSIKGSDPWRQSMIPLIYIHLDSIEHKIYITGEIPKSFLELDEFQRTSESNAWFLDILYKFYHYRFTPENILENWVFTHDPKIFKRSIVALPNDSKCFIIGDALLPANFLFGHGAHKAILDAHESVKALLGDTVAGGNIVIRNIMSYRDIYMELEACRYPTRKFADDTGEQIPPDVISMIDAVLPNLGESLGSEIFDPWHSA